MWVRWRRLVAVFYGCALLLIFGIIELTKPSTPTPGETSQLQAAHGDLGDDLSGKAQ
jgi:hypothetical protein